MIDRDYWRKPPCSCPECHQAGVSGLEQVRDWNTQELLHGYRLKSWYDARDKALSLLARVKGKGMP